MKYKTKNQFIGLIALVAVTAHAQSIQRVTEEYRDPEQIKLAAPSDTRGKAEQGTIPRVQDRMVPAPRGEPEVQVAPTPLAVSSVEPFAIQPGQRLSQALAMWLKTQEINLSWEAAGSLPGRIRDIVVDSAWQASDTNLEKTLTDVLLPFGLEAHVLKTNQKTVGPTAVVVRNLSNTRP
jgi:hypothetical protein